MEFLKSCLTNVHAIEDVAHTPYAIYAWPGPDSGEGAGAVEGGDDSQTQMQMQMQQLLCALRIKGRLSCLSVQLDSIWLFGSVGQQQDEQEALPPLLHHTTTTLRLPKQHQGMLHQAESIARDMLLLAIQGALAFTLTSSPSALPLGPWTWLYYDAPNLDSGFSQDAFGDRSGDGSGSGGIDGDSGGDEHPARERYLITIRINFTLTGGLCFISHVRRAPSFVTPATHVADRMNHGHELILAPYGNLAHPVSPSDSHISDHRWQADVTRTLQTQGISLPPHEEWLLVRLRDSREVPCCSWPASLCFVLSKSSSHAPHQSPLTGDDWRRWFISTEDGAMFRNPLSMVEEWYKTSGDRHQTAKDDNLASNLSIEHSIVDPSPLHASDSGLVTSPPFTQRGIDQQAPMLGIYPTPPDGFVPFQNITQINAATPSAIQTDLEVAACETMAMNDAYSTTNVGLLPDLGGMEFGDNEVDDTDFNFFDNDDADSDMAMDALENVDGHEAVETTASPFTYDGNMDMTECSPTEPSFRSEGPCEGSKATTPEILETALTTDVANALLPVKSKAFPPPAAHELGKPLSPFGIRERLFPLPVPASLAHESNREHPINRRSSAFGPIEFREGNSSLLRRYANVTIGSKLEKGPSGPKVASSIGLPPSRRKSKMLRQDIGSNMPSDSDSVGEGADLYDPSSSDVDEEEPPPKLPWESGKRKRHTPQDSALQLANSLYEASPTESTANQETFKHSRVIGTLALLKAYTSASTADIASTLRSNLHSETISQEVADLLDHVGVPQGCFPKIQELHELRDEDMICIAQIVSEQAITTLQANYPIAQSYDELQTPTQGIPNTIRLLVERAVHGVSVEAELGDLASVALTREPQRTPTNAGKTPQGYPRAPQRIDSVPLGPDVFSLPTPHVKMQRGSDTWEMLSSSLNFWEALGLGPINQPKSVRAFCVFPLNEDLQRLVSRFISELGNAYETCKLGPHVHLRNASETNEFDTFQDGMAPVELDENTSLEGVLKAYAATCAQLGKTLADAILEEDNHAIVVYMINPFTGPHADHHLCACFWILFKAYRDNLPKPRRTQCHIDIFPQLLPINIVTSFDTLAVPDSQQMAKLGREVYDRCPPASTLQNTDEILSPLPMVAAPALELASVAPKKIGFQLSSEPPSDLIYEGSILHIAYARSGDGQWLTAAWIDSTGKHYSTSSFCVRGRSFVQVAEDVWESTQEILAARQVLWRIFIAAAEDMDESTLQCWRKVLCKPRVHPLCVTLLSVSTDPALQLSPPRINFDGQPSTGSDGGFLTPASTPQNTTFISSPDLTGHGGNNPPLTPAPSEIAAPLIENDPDAHLVDLTDETWGVLLSQKVSCGRSNAGLANGALFQRGNTALIEGESVSIDTLPSLGVSLHWIFQIKPQGAIDEGSLKQGEMTLRETLKMYRSLSLLTRARGLNYGRTAFVPMHVAMAIRGAEGLNGMLGAAGGP